MCHGCWIVAGKPHIVNDKVRAAVPLIEELYNWFPSGGMLHVVVDDYNIEQRHTDYCMDNMDSPPAWRDEPITEIERRCGKALQDMTDEERGSAVALHDGYINDKGEEVIQ